MACSSNPSQSPSISPAASESASNGPPGTGIPCKASILLLKSPGTFYELFVRSFADSNGDGIGDLRGLTEHLDYLNDGDPSTTDDLGVSGLWLMPVAESPSYHGYDVTDYTAIERDYGTREDFLAFVDAAHERGITVLVDFVINHTSRNHPWFQDAQTPGSEHDRWYVWSDTDPGWPPAAGPNPWHPNGGRFYYGAFWEGMPDLNLRNDDVTSEIARIAHVWIDEYGVDGFRLDAAKHLIEDGPDAQVNTPETHAWLKAFNDAVGRPGKAFVLGEVWEPRITTVGYIEDGSLDLVFDFGTGPAIENAVRLGDSATLEATQAEILTRYPQEGGTAATFLTNHDQPRILTDLRGNVEQARQAAAALLTGPGVPFVYYGEELGLVGTKPDEQIRTPFPWTADGPGFGFTTAAPWEPFADGAATSNVATESADNASLLSAYRDLIRVRSENAALAAGDYVTVDTGIFGISAVLRTTPKNSVLVVHNLTNEPANDLEFSGESPDLCGQPSGALVYSSDTTITGPASGPTIGAGGRLEPWTPLPVLPAHSTVVFDLSP